MSPSTRTIDLFARQSAIFVRENRTVWRPLKRANEVVRKLKAHFARHGCPETLCSDNGPPFNSKDFANFAEDFGFEHNEFAEIPEIEREI